MSIEESLGEGQDPTQPERSPRRWESMETIVIVAVLVGYFTLMRWILPRMGVPT